MSTDTENVVQQWEVCQKFQKCIVKQPLISHVIPQRPFDKTGIDILEFRNASCFVIFYFFSKWIKTEKLNNKSESDINQKSKVLFFLYGILIEVVSIIQYFKI